MNTSHLLHFAFEDSTESMHVTVTEYHRGNGNVEYRLSYSNTLSSTPLTVTSPDAREAAMLHGRHIIRDYKRELIDHLTLLPRR